MLLRDCKAGLLVRMGSNPYDASEPVYIVTRDKEGTLPVLVSQYGTVLTWHGTQEVVPLWGSVADVVTFAEQYRG